MAGNGFLLIARDLPVREAGELIVALIVFLDVLEAEQKELPFRIAPDRGAMRAVFVAAVPLARRRTLFGFLRALAAGANAIEIF